MATIKSYTDLEQSKKLAEILPIESADMYYPWDIDNKSFLSIPIVKDDSYYVQGSIPCWSLAALLNYLREIDFFPEIDADELGVTMYICYYNEDGGKLLNPMHEISTKADNLIDACYELILKAHESNLL